MGMRLGRLRILWVLCTFPSLASAGDLGYYRYPALHGGTVVFAAEGDLWTVGVDGGLARRLTTHPSEESHPAVSQDGSTLAFSAAYEGPREVYTMPLEGGLPERRTFDGEASHVVGWTPDGRILFRSLRPSTLPSAMLVAFDPATRSRSVLPLAEASEGSFDPAAGVLYFTRFSAQGSHTKRYKGGTAQSIWSFAPGAPEAVALTAGYAGTSRHPMWWNGEVHFVSDRDGTMNIWSMDPSGGGLRQRTFHDGWDVQSPALSEGRIVYRLGADLRLYDVESGLDREIPITLASDFDQLRENWIHKPMEYLTAAHISPEGDRVALTARGQVFVAPARQGRFVEATRRPGVRYRQARFMPGGEHLMALSDESGEVELWRLPSDGIGEPKQWTSDGKVLRFDGVPSPDGRWIVTNDHDQELWLFNTETNRSSRIASSSSWGYGGIAWSPDSRWIAYAMPGGNTVFRIFLYDVSKGKTTAVTTDRYDSSSPSWSPDGRWIYFLSDRDFESIVPSPWGSRQPEPFFDKMTRVYSIPLVAGLRSPFQPDDELAPSEDEEDKEEEEGDEDPPEVAVDLEGIAERILLVPVDRGNYSDLSMNGERLFLVRSETSVERTKDLLAVKIDNEDPEALSVARDIAAYEISSDGEKLLIRKKEALYVIDADAGEDADLSEAAVDLSGWRFSIDPKEEFRQMFIESWRLERDYFYDRSMHDVDWPAMLDKYLPLVERVTTRGELSDLQAQMAGEISALHTYVYGGEHRKGEDDVFPASLGAVLARDDEAGGYRVERIYRSDPDSPGARAPLAAPGVDVAEGDVIAAIDGKATLDAADPGLLLRNRSGRQVRLRIQPASGRGARDVIVTPISAAGERDLRYDAWEVSRRDMTDSLGAGEIGYVHLRAMGREDIAEWYKQFYPVFDRKGIVIDVRHNDGGNIDSWILEKLMRRAWMFWQARVGEPYWNMHYAFRGHMAVLVDAWTTSDGEAFAEGFRRLGLGKVIGTRTWGGEIWLTSSNVLVDEGIVTAAEFGVYGPEGEWLIEGHGVDPDIVVDNLPHATYLGDDAQLRRAIEHLQGLIERDPRPLPLPPPYPDKSFRGNGGPRN